MVGKPMGGVRSCVRLAGADRFLTNNRKDFPGDIPEIDVVYPDTLAAGS